MHVTNHDALPTWIHAVEPSLRDHFWEETGTVDFEIRSRETAPPKWLQEKYLAQLNSISHPHNNELGTDNLVQASTVQLPDNCTAGVSKDRLDTVILVSRNPILQKRHRMKHEGKDRAYNLGQLQRFTFRGLLKVIWHMRHRESWIWSQDFFSPMLKHIFWMVNIAWALQPISYGSSIPSKWLLAAGLHGLPVSTYIKKVPYQTSHMNLPWGNVLRKRQHQWQGTSPGQQNQRRDPWPSVHSRICEAQAWQIPHWRRRVERQCGAWGCFPAHMLLGTFSGFCKGHWVRWWSNQHLSDMCILDAQLTMHRTVPRSKLRGSFVTYNKHLTDQDGFPLYLPSRWHATPFKGK